MLMTDDKLNRSQFCRTEQYLIVSKRIFKFNIRFFQEIFPFQFVQLNKTGFRKVLKKYDKTLDRKLKSTYVKQKVEPAYPFLESTIQVISDNIAKMEKAYADVVTKGDVEKARKELRLHLRSLSREQLHRSAP